MNGTVKFFNEMKGFGFVTGEDEKEYFAHHTQLPDNQVLNTDDEVEFDEAETEKGLQAHNIKIV